MVNRNVRIFLEVVDALDDVHDLFTPLCCEAIVVCSVSSHMYCELLDVLARWNSLSHTNYVFNFDDSLD